MANSVLYGFHKLQHLADERVTTVGVDVISAAIAAAVAEHNRQLNALLGALTFPTIQFQTRFQSVTAARLQPLDQDGRAIPIRPAGYYTVAFPVQKAGIAWGANFETSVKMTVGEAERITQTMLMADARWLRDHILAALFASTAWTFPDPLQGDLKVQGLANGDTVPYLIKTGQDSPATDTHYLAQAAAIADGTNPYPTIYTELIEHPENGGQVVCLIPTALRATTEALATFYEISDPNIAQALTAARLTGSLPDDVPGTVIGYADRCWIVEWPVLPATEIVAYTTGGDPPLARREEPEPELRGFILEAQRSNHPFFESQYVRRVGFGAWNRVGAVVYHVGDASYSVPTGYDSPMA